MADPISSKHHKYQALFLYLTKTFNQAHPKSLNQHPIIIVIEIKWISS